MKQKTITSSEILSKVAVKGLQEVKGLDIVIMDLRNVVGAVSDFFIVCSGTSDRHCQALANSVEEFARKDLKDKPINIEGYQQGEWVLIDFVDVVVHVFQKDRRDFYDIEGLWADADFKKVESLY